MNELGRLEDLPADYREALTQRCLVPLWPTCARCCRAGAHAQDPPTFWAYATIKPLLLKRELTPIEKANAGAVLANPATAWRNAGHAAMYLGMQLLRRASGTGAPHTRTPAPDRRGESAYTTVGGEKCVMQRGDLISRPPACGTSMPRRRPAGGVARRARLRWCTTWRPATTSTVRAAVSRAG